jgi:hypothetical protein
MVHHFYETLATIGLTAHHHIDATRHMTHGASDGVIERFLVVL